LFSPPPPQKTFPPNEEQSPPAWAFSPGSPTEKVGDKSPPPNPPRGLMVARRFHLSISFGSLPRYPSPVHSEPRLRGGSFSIRISVHRGEASALPSLALHTPFPPHSNVGKLPTSSVSPVHYQPAELSLFCSLGFCSRARFFSFELLPRKVLRLSIGTPFNPCFSFSSIKRRHFCASWLFFFPIFWISELLL